MDAKPSARPRAKYDSKSQEQERASERASERGGGGGGGGGGAVRREDGQFASIYSLSNRTLDPGFGSSDYDVLCRCDTLLCHPETSRRACDLETAA